MSAATLHDLLAEAVDLLEHAATVHESAGRDALAASHRSAAERLRGDLPEPA